MNNDAVFIFREEQKFPAWLCWLVYLSMGLAAALNLYALKKVLSGQHPPEMLEIFLTVIIGVGVPLAIAALFLFLKMETEVRQDGVYIRFYPFHMRFRKFPREDLSEYYARQYRPIREYGGWGIRYSFTGKGRAYNVRGNQGVQLVFKNGRKLLIGSQKAQELEEALKILLS